MYLLDIFTIIEELAVIGFLSRCMRFQFIHFLTNTNPTIVICNWLWSLFSPKLYQLTPLIGTYDDFREKYSKEITGYNNTMFQRE